MKTKPQVSGSLMDVTIQSVHASAGFKSMFGQGSSMQPIQLFILPFKMVDNLCLWWKPVKDELWEFRCNDDPVSDLATTSKAQRDGDEPRQHILL